MITVHASVPAAQRPGLPHYRELTAVFRRTIEPSDGQVLRWARQLAVLHRMRGLHPGVPRVFDTARANVRARISGWIVDHIGARPDAATRCAAAVDDLAAAHVAAEALLRAPSRVSDEQLHAAWSRVGYIATHWADLVAEVVEGQRPVPHPDRGHL